MGRWQVFGLAASLFFLFRRIKKRQEKSLKTDVFRQIMVEHRRFELLTPTLPVLCATNCANAPSTKIIIAQLEEGCQQNSENCHAKKEKQLD